jgi:hypothetical protein
VSWKEHLKLTIQGFIPDTAKTFLSYLDWMTLFLNIISDFFNFLIATGYPDLFHLQSLTYPNAPFPIIFIGVKSMIVILVLYCLNISAYSCTIFFLISFC